MTEAEALTKRCCGPNGCGTVKRPDGGPPKWEAGVVNAERFCVGSACMAFRQAGGGHFCGLAVKP